MGRTRIAELNWGSKGGVYAAMRRLEGGVRQLGRAVAGQCGWPMKLRHSQRGQGKLKDVEVGPALSPGSLSRWHPTACVLPLCWNESLVIQPACDASQAMMP